MEPSASPQATRDLAQYDAAHHEEFKRYEMLKEHERRRYLESLGEEQRKEAERKLQEQQRRHREHPKVNVPVRTPMYVYRVQLLSIKRNADAGLELPGVLEAKSPPAYVLGIVVPT